MNAEEQVNRIFKAYKERTINRVFLIACGGSSALMYPSKYLIDHEATTITAEVYNSNEFIFRNPATLGDESLVILFMIKEWRRIADLIRIGKYSELKLPKAVYADLRILMNHREKSC